MKKYISKFLLCLFKILGKLIPYFNHKYMALYKNSILGYIDTDVLNHLKTYPKYSLFTVILNRLALVSNGNYHKVKFEIIYQNISFDIFIEYNNGMIVETSFLNSSTLLEDMIEIGNFCNHFKSNSKTNLNTLFPMLTGAV